MPITLTTSFSRKLGQPNYSSVGASCQIQCELDGTLLAHDLDEFHQRVRSAYAACARAVDDELARHLRNQGSTGGHEQTQPDPAAGPTKPKGNMADTAPANFQTGRRGRGATSAQQRAIGRLAARSNVELPALLEEDFGVAGPDQLNVAEAAQLILYLQKGLPQSAASD